MDQQTPAPAQTPPPAQPAAPAMPQQPQPEQKKRGGMLSLLVKIFLFLILAVGLLFGGFYLGTQANSIAPTPSPTPEPTKAASAAPTETRISPTPASQNTKPVKAGLAGDATVFEPYIIDVPEGWTDARETTVAAGIDKLTLTKNGYSVTIYQAPMGGGGCIYEEDAANEFSQLYTNYADINGKSAQYRRSWTESEGKSLTYAVCQKIEDGSYSVMSTFGAITVVSPNPANAAMLTEIDGIIASLIKQ